MLAEVVILAQTALVVVSAIPSQVLCPQKLSPCPLTIWTWRNGLKRLRIGLIFGKQLEHLGIKISEILKQRKT